MSRARAKAAGEREEAGDEPTVPAVSVYCDGACRGNPGVGAYAAILCFPDREVVLSAAVERTTNNRMELTAALEGLRALEGRHKVRIVTDSQYLQRGITEWMDRWIRRGWRTSANKGVVNRDLWEQIHALCQTHETSWEWVPGHTGHEFNERCDRLANQAIDKYLLGQRDGR